MKDAIGGSLLLSLVVVFTSVVILLFAGIITYSKAYKVKNKIIEVIERYDGEIMDKSNTSKINAVVLDEINTELNKVGYKISGAPTNSKCSRDSSRGACTNLNTSSYNYCICSQSGATTDGQSFEVITYVHFEFPVVGDLLTFPVKGETKALGKVYDY